MITFLHHASLAFLINRQPINAIIEKPVKTNIGRGIFNSTINGDVAWKKRPNKLQIPKAVPQRVTGKIQGVAI